MLLDDIKAMQLGRGRFGRAGLTCHRFGLRRPGAEVLTNKPTFRKRGGHGVPPLTFIPLAAPSPMAPSNTSQKTARNAARDPSGDAVR